MKKNRALLLALVGVLLASFIGLGCSKPAEEVGPAAQKPPEGATGNVPPPGMLGEPQLNPNAATPGK